MSYTDKLPQEIYDYILWLSSGAISLEMYNKKKEIKEEFDYYKNIRAQYDATNIWYSENSEKYGKDGVYLSSIGNYRKTPELGFYEPSLAHISISIETWLEEYGEYGE